METTGSRHKKTNTSYNKETGKSYKKMRRKQLLSHKKLHVIREKQSNGCLTQSRPTCEHCNKTRQSIQETEATSRRRIQGNQVIVCGETMYETPLGLHQIGIFQINKATNYCRAQELDNKDRLLTVEAYSLSPADE